MVNEAVTKSDVTQLIVSRIWNKIKEISKIYELLLTSHNLSSAVKIPK